MLLKVLFIAAIAAAGLASAVRLFEARFAFFPSKGETTTPADEGVPFTSTAVRTADGEQLRAWALPHPSPRAQILYFHGNGGNLSIWAPILAGIHRQGFSVNVIDYRGYGASTGRPTERGLYRDADAAVDWIWSERHTDAPLIYWGRSLGATIAAYAASKRPPDGLILEAGFSNARSLLRSSPPLRFLALFSSYRFPTADFVQRTRVPVLIMHGDADRVIPFESGVELFAHIREPKQFVAIRGGDHNDLTPASPEAYWDAVRKFVASVESKAS